VSAPVEERGPHGIGVLSLMARFCRDLVWKSESFRHRAARAQRQRVYPRALPFLVAAAALVQEKHKSTTCASIASILFDGSLSDFG